MGRGIGIPLPGVGLGFQEAFVHIIVHRVQTVCVWGGGGGVYEDTGQDVGRQALCVDGGAWPQQYVTTDRDRWCRGNNTATPFPPPWVGKSNRRKLAFSAAEWQQLLHPKRCTATHGYKQDCLNVVGSEDSAMESLATTKRTRLALFWLGTVS